MVQNKQRVMVEIHVLCDLEISVWMNSLSFACQLERQRRVLHEHNSRSNDSPSTFFENFSKIIDKNFTGCPISLEYWIESVWKSTIQFLWKFLSFEIIKNSILLPIKLNIANVAISSQWAPEVTLRVTSPLYRYNFSIFKINRKSTFITTPYLLWNYFQVLFFMKVMHDKYV